MGCQCRRLFDAHSESTCVAPDPKSSTGRNALKHRCCHFDNMVEVTGFEPPRWWAASKNDFSSGDAMGGNPAVQ